MPLLCSLYSGDTYLSNVLPHTYIQYEMKGNRNELYNVTSVPTNLIYYLYIYKKK